MTVYYRCHHETLFEAYEHLLLRRRIAAPNFGFFIQLIRYENDLHKNRINSDAKTSTNIDSTIVGPSIVQIDLAKNVD